MERKLEMNEDTDLWIGQLEQMKSQLETQFSEKIIDEEFKILIIGGTNKLYSQVRGNLEFQFTDEPTKLTIEKIKTQLRVRYKSIDKDQNQKVGLNITKNFKGLCQNCGKRGHQRRFCWENNSNK